MMTFDRYAYRNRLVAQDVRIKVLSYLVLLGISFTGILSWQLGLVALVCSLSLYVGRVHWQTYLTWLVWPLPFVLLSLVTILISFQETTSSEILWAYPFWGGYFVISETSWQQAMSLLVRVYASLVSSYFLALTVPFRQLIGLLKRVGVPAYLLEVMVLMYRFIFMFLQEFMVMRDTLDLKFAFGNFQKTYRSLGLLASQLFTRLMRANDELTAILALKFDD